MKSYTLQIIRVWNHTRMKSYTLQIIRVWNDDISLDDQRHTPVLLSPRNARRNVLRHDGVCAMRDVAVTRSWRNDSRAVTQVCRQLNALICNTDSTVSQPPISLLIHVHCHQNLHFNLDMRHKLTLGLDVVLWMRQATSVAHFEWRHNDWHWPIKDHYFIRVLLLLHDRKVSRNISYVYEFIRRRFQKFHETFHTCMNSYVEDCIRVSNQTRLKQYVYVKFREWYCIMIHV